jgi:hypothetical protein
VDVLGHNFEHALHLAVDGKTASYTIVSTPSPHLITRGTYRSHTP